MYRCIEFAGFAAAQVVCCLFDRQPFVPLAFSPRKDAIILDIRGYRAPACQMRMAVPYRPHHDPKGFAVHRPKFIAATLERQDGLALQDAFFRGVYSHDYGCRIWRECSDQSW